MVLLHYIILLNCIIIYLSLCLISKLFTLGNMIFTPASRRNYLSKKISDIRQKGMEYLLVIVYYLILLHYHYLFSIVFYYSLSIFIYDILLFFYFHLSYSSWSCATFTVLYVVCAIVFVSIFLIVFRAASHEPKM